MSDSPGPGYTFGHFRLEPDGTLYRGDTAIHLSPRELAALRYLLHGAGQIVTPLELRQELWGEVHVPADSVPRCLSDLRARLEPDDCIQTVYKRGYRFSAEVRRHNGSPSQPLLRLAIMPFASGYSVPEHLGPAIAESAIARLAALRPQLVTVLPRDSVFTLARRGITAQQLGATLQASLVLTGVLLALPAHYRLRVEMIQVEDGTQVWVEDVLVPQSRLAGLESILVDRLSSRMDHGAPGNHGPHQGAGVASGGESTRSNPLTGNFVGVSIAAAANPGERETGPQNLEAYQIFQRAHYEWQSLQRHRMQDALQHLSRATELDPSLIAAKVDLVHLCVTQSYFGFMSPAIAADLVRRTAESMPDLPHRATAILPALGWVNFHVDHNLPAALWAFSLSAHLPHDTWNTRERVMLSLSRRRFVEAEALMQSALREDPYAPWLHARMAWTFHLAGQAAESMEQIHRSHVLFPDDEGIALYGAMILAFNGDHVGAVKLARNYAERQPYIDLGAAVHAYALACADRRDEARAMLERLQWLSRERFVLRSFTPAVHVALGEHEAALVELRAAEADRCPWFFQMLADPRLKALQGHSDFQRMGEILPRMEAAVADDPGPDY